LLRSYQSEDQQSWFLNFLSITTHSVSYCSTATRKDGSAVRRLTVFRTAWISACSTIVVTCTSFLVV
jgi:hypothetical protein